jgi:hypothetical protein
MDSARWSNFNSDPRTLASRKISRHNKAPKTTRTPIFERIPPKLCVKALSVDKRARMSQIMLGKEGD